MHVPEASSNLPESTSTPTSRASSNRLSSLKAYARNAAVAVLSSAAALSEAGAQEPVREQRSFSLEPALKAPPVDLPIQKTATKKEGMKPSPLKVMGIIAIMKNEIDPIQIKEIQLGMRAIRAIKGDMAVHRELIREHKEENGIGMRLTYHLEKGIIRTKLRRHAERAALKHNEKNHAMLHVTTEDIQAALEHMVEMENKAKEKAAALAVDIPMPDIPEILTKKVEVVTPIITPPSGPDVAPVLPEK